MYISYNKHFIVNVISSSPIEAIQPIKKTDHSLSLGKRMPNTLLSISDFQKKDFKDLRVAIVCNWNDTCGISTYSKYLVDEMIPQVKDLKIFSEINDANTDGYTVDKCWERGKCLLPLIAKIKEWGADYVIVQHEFGLFPNAFYFSQFCQHLGSIPYIISMHSVYEHLDKLVYSEAAKNILVHTQNQKDVLRKLGNTSNIFIIPHGCVSYSTTDELWNINQNPYTIIQFGFGFSYKGVDKALRALHHLKTTDEKFKNIFYTYLLSENSHNAAVNQNYYDSIMNMVKELDLEENVTIIKKYQSEDMLCLYLRLNKLCIFPYINNPNNTVFSASGAIRLAIANKRPVIASESHLFDDFEGIIPRPSTDIELANEIDRIFSDESYKNSIVEKAQNYVNTIPWSKCAADYLSIYNQLVNN